MNWISRSSVLLTVIVSLTFVVIGQNKPASPPVQAQEVKYDGHEVKLAGTLLFPKLEAGKRAPGILIVAGSEATTRDGVEIGAAKQPVYRELAEHLAARGFAVLRYDKRCAGQSECKKATVFDDYIDDARLSAEFLKKQPQVDPAKVFLFGHSEGGYIISSIAAQEDAKFAGVVLAASPGRHLHKILRDQLKTRMTEAGKTPQELDAYLAKFDRIVRGMQGGLAEFPGEKLDAKDPYDAVLIGLIKQRDIVASLFINDPLQIVNNIKAPTLILQGRKDIQLAVKDAQFIEEAMKRASHEDVTLQLLDDADHFLKTNKGPVTEASQADTARPLDAVMLTILTDWLVKKAK
ncbi:MAG TPA: alpha/beta fold hydrolase [Blastocatellia bacterium]|nr:alpha/beta fold hydrolase [Blastocatellia bacterium]